METLEELKNQLRLLRFEFKFLQMEIAKEKDKEKLEQLNQKYIFLKANIKMLKSQIARRIISEGNEKNEANIRK